MVTTTDYTGQDRLLTYPGHQETMAVLRIRFIQTTIFLDGLVPFVASHCSRSVTVKVKAFYLSFSTVHRVPTPTPLPLREGRQVEII